MQKTAEINNTGIESVPLNIYTAEVGNEHKCFVFKQSSRNHEDGKMIENEVWINKEDVQELIEVLENA